MRDVAIISIVAAVSEERCISKRSQNGEDAYDTRTAFDYPPLHDYSVRMSSISLQQRASEVLTYILSIPEADEVLPSSKNHGLNPSDDFA